MRRAEQLPMLAGALCLDFANTLECRGSPRELEALQSGEDLLLWGVRASAMSKAPSRIAAEELQAARDFREAIYSVFSSVAGSRHPDQTAVAALNGVLGPSLARTEMRLEGNGAKRIFADGAGGLEQLLWAVAWSVHDLLLGRELERVRECSDNECHWLFIDHSRNRSRRWCDMANCGNLAKVRRFRKRL